MTRIRPADVERMEGPDPSTDRVCITHDKPIEVCKRCDAEFFRCCITYIMENRPGICGDCGMRDYQNELFCDLRDPAYDDAMGVFAGHGEMEATDELGDRVVP